MTSRPTAAPLTPLPATAPLLVTDDPALVAELQRLAAAAGTLLTVVSDAAEARSRWSASSVVLVAVDALASLAAVAPARRDRVHVVAPARCGAGDEVFRAALDIGAQSVVELPAGETWLVETLADTAEGTTSAARVVSVVGGCGGAGATTFATALAAATAGEGEPVTLIDADPLGAGIERVAGLDDLEGAGWGSLLESTGRLGSRSLRAALPQREGLAVLGWGAGPWTDLQPHVAREVLSAAGRGSRLVVVDLPRYSDAVVSELLLCSDDLVVVCPLALSCVAATARVLARMQPLVPRAHLVARGPAAALDADEVAEALGLPLVAVMADQRRLDEAVELGLGPLHARRGPLARAARSVLVALDAPSPGSGVAA